VLELPALHSDKLLQGPIVSLALRLFENFYAALFLVVESYTSCEVQKQSMLYIFSDSRVGVNFHVRHCWYWMCMRGTELVNLPRYTVHQTWNVVSKFQCTHGSGQGKVLLDISTVFASRLVQQNEVSPN
jgi:hypothetical protein